MVQLYSKRKNQIQYAQKTNFFILEELSRLRGEFKKIKTRELWEYPETVRNHPLSIDLDLCTKQGFLGIYDTTITEIGFETYLKRFLQEPIENTSLHSDPSEIQHILKKKSSYGYHLLRKFLVPDGEPNEKFSLPQVHAEDSFWKKRRFLKGFFPIWGFLSPFYIVLGLLFDLPLIPFLLLTNGILFVSYRRDSLKQWKEIRALSSAASRFQKTFIYLAKERKSTKQMIGLISSLGDSSELLISPLPHLILNILCLWDLWKIKALEKWKNKFGKLWNELQVQMVRTDSILPFVNFGFLFPEARFAELSNSGPLCADSLVHPLLPKSSRVFNPLAKMEPGDLMIVTGSNMSGKTTYLRSIAMSLLLAGSGAPVLGSNFKFPKFKIHTLIRSQDSMEDGVSFFYSEVRRLSSIIQTAEHSDQVPILFLDEILKGTNSKERYIATREILSVLREKQTIVFLTTHDLKLAEIPWAKRFHFTELEVGGQMDFDYKIRDGVSGSTNALKILKKEGIPIRNEEE
ncbi:AAA family ATPase [Leptospira sp. 2 VSF19]|uniref:AAA family ATPase n=1 Tax=Leptospira soteropolitanensis TaxID=2950025 RepID=A0AAW5VIJ2_9LEPT|nr:AAA family ATPase [Leptospira soteropolitanensis]MCW7491867.1 AAA family ATPase [Leptospira soteropolitanensis]MCW7499451.1 AAA family ATPase [Leptospira soteropolitanensis]MCW7520958.1 AAA family ATPase [Leptospira soteropolitanensis]MCW7525555.1 AAA family ATPase [Leptospira soteropolitanensis]MCW7529421.1 AAA family ATPase [Leptospira soteropolitanensis]